MIGIELAIEIAYSLDLFNFMVGSTLEIMRVGSTGCSFVDRIRE